MIIGDSTYWARYFIREALPLGLPLSFGWSQPQIKINCSLSFWAWVPVRLGWIPFVVAVEQVPSTSASINQTKNGKMHEEAGSWDG